MHILFPAEVFLLLDDESKKFENVSDGRSIVVG